MSAYDPDPPPVAPITVRIEIRAERWDYVESTLRSLLQGTDGRDPSTFQIMSGGGGGSHHATTTTRDVSTEEYRAELEAWRQRLVARRHAEALS